MRCSAPDVTSSFFNYIENSFFTNQKRCSKEDEHTGKPGAGQRFAFGHNLEVECNHFSNTEL